VKLLRRSFCACANGLWISKDARTARLANEILELVRRQTSIEVTSCSEGTVPDGVAINPVRFRSLYAGGLHT
jgi:hypothetical protein